MLARFKIQKIFHAHCNRKSSFNKFHMHTFNGESPEVVFTAVTEQPMMSPCRRTPRYQLGPTLFNLISSNPAFLNHSIYSSSLGKSIHTSAMILDSQNVGYTGPITHAIPPGFSTRYASAIPRCGSGQYSMLQKCEGDQIAAITTFLTLIYNFSREYY